MDTVNLPQINVTPDPQVSIDPYSNTPDTASIDTGSYSTPVTPEVAADRAFKAHFGLGTVLDKGYEDIYSTIVNGGEKDIRREAASSLDEKNARARQQLIMQLANKRVSAEEFNAAMDPEVPGNKPVDPESVIERGWGHAYMSTLDIANSYMDNNTILSSAKQDFPNIVEQKVQAGADIASKRAYLATLAQDTKAKIDNQSWAGWGLDLGLTFVGPYNQYMMRGNTPGTGYLEGGGLLGSNLDAQTNELLLMPFDQFKQKAKDIVDNLNAHNPQLAMRFIDAAFGQSSGERFLANMFTPLDIAMIPGVTSLGRGLVRKMGVLNDSTKAVKDMVEANASTQAEMLNAAGNPKEAAIKQTASNIVEGLKGTSMDPIKRVLQPVTTNMRVDLDTAKSNPGRFGQEIVNRMSESAEKDIDNLQTVVSTALKPDRLADVVMAEAQVRKLEQGMRDNYRGPSSKLIDIEGPFRENVTNTRWYNYLIGREDGSLFRSREQAANDAKLNGLILEATPHDLPNMYQRILEMKADLKAGPSMDADTAELNRFAEMPKQLAALEREHADLAKRGPGGYTIVEAQGPTIDQQGLGFYIRQTAPLNENMRAVWDTMGQIEGSKLPASWVNATVGWLRTPEDTLSQIENMQRKIATHGPAVLLQFAKESAKDVEKLPGKFWKDWERTVDFARKAIDPKDGQPGYFFEHPQELEDFYQMVFKRLPEMPEIEAYFTFKRNNEIDRVFREISMFRNKARIGVEQHRFYHLDDQGNRVYTDFVDGIIQKEFPGGEATVVRINDKQGSEQIFSTNGINALTSAKRKALEKDVSEGREYVIKFFDPDLKPLRDYGDKVGNDRVQYVITKNLETRPLELGQQVNRRGGGHFDYDYNLWLKQAVVEWDKTIGKWIYLGDRTVMPFNNGKLARDIGDHFEKVQDLIKAKRLPEAKDYVENHLNMPWEEHYAHYQKTKDAAGKDVGPMLDKTMPFHVVPNGKLISDLDNSLFKRPEFLNKKGESILIDGTREGSPARQFQVQYTGARDAINVHTINDKGTKGNPIYQYEPAEFVDPLPTLHRALNRVINSVYMDDMKAYSVMHWIKEATPYLRGEQKDFEHAPFYHFAEPKFRSGVETQHPQIYRALIDARDKINQFVGTPSKVDTFLHSAGQKLADATYGKYGQKAAAIPEAMIPYLKDPLAFIRTMTFHLKMGLFAVPQFFTQLTTFSNVMALGGIRNALPVTGATLLHQWSRMNASPEILAGLDKMASNMSWKPGQWLEAHELSKQTGFFTLGNEHAFIDTPWRAKVVQGVGGKLLDWGETFFREGALNTRYAAFYMAYKEFRDGGGGKAGFKGSSGKIGDQELTEILSRAALLDHNQSRASSSVLHTGVMAPAGQFLAYSMRITEMMLGKRLTIAEKARLFTTSAALYGIPIGGLGLFGVPVADYLKTKAKEQGYVVGDNYINSLLMEGGMSALGAVITGNGDASAGNWYNFSKFGTKGIDAISDSMNSDKTIWDIFGGASISTVGNFWKQSSGLRAAMGSMIMGQTDKIPLKLTDLTDMTNEAAIVNDTKRWLIALHTANWVSKNETVLQSGITPGNATFMSALGISNQRTADLTITSKAIKAQKELEETGLQQFVKNMHRHWEALADKNEGQADAFLRTAYGWLEKTGYPQVKRPAAMTAALEGQQDLVNRLDDSYYTRNVPSGAENVRTDAYRTIQQINKKQGRL